MTPAVDPLRRAAGLKAAQTMRARREQTLQQRWASYPPLDYSMTEPSPAFLREVLRCRPRCAPDASLRVLLLAWAPWPPTALLLALAALREQGEVVQTGRETYRLTETGQRRERGTP
jgi:hypothetical protein